MHMKTIVGETKSAIAAALPLLKADRRIIVEAHTLRSKKTGRPLLSTMESAVAPLVAEYDAAIKLCQRALRR